MGKALRVEPAPLLVFVETLLPHGVDAVRAHGVEYVSQVVACDLPDGFDAVRFRGVAFTQKPRSF